VSHSVMSKSDRLMPSILEAVKARQGRIKASNMAEFRRMLGLNCAVRTLKSAFWKLVESGHLKHERPRPQRASESAGDHIFTIC